MTYKHEMAFKWFIQNCPDVNFLLKTDDDVFVNSPVLYESVEKLSNSTPQMRAKNLVICTEVEKPKVKRSFRSKWRVSYAVYADKYYPNYCSGFSVLYTADVVFKLYNLTQILPYFWIDDVHISGVVRLVFHPFYRIFSASFVAENVFLFFAFIQVTSGHPNCSEKLVISR